ncbi:hypothetical protein AAF712_014833 [Marasmius tenuissimus]|uniref:DUF6589 domain-containing protein n=1 Tax=Marasmius tenuissimus TaxID=585030 RepID=A0ABR2ZB15_9AGAR
MFNSLMAQSSASKHTNTSILEDSLIVLGPGRPLARKGSRHRNLTSFAQQTRHMSFASPEARREALRVAEEAKKAGDEAIELSIAATKEVDSAQSIFAPLSKPESAGGFRFRSPRHFVDHLFQTGSNKQGKTNVTNFCKNHGADVATKMFQRSPQSFNKFRDGYLADKVQEEGLALQKLLTKAKGTTMNDLLTKILQGFVSDGKESARETGEKGKGKGKEKTHCLSSSSGARGKESEGKSGKSEKEKDRDVVRVSPHSLSSPHSNLRHLDSRHHMLNAHSQKANSFQVVMGLFLLASGASKREVDVLAHAGLMVSYTSILHHMKTLSQENLEQVQKVAKEFMVGLIWDNVNFAFRVDSQRLDSKDHFDSGTTATAVVQHDPFTNQPALQGSLPIYMKPSRETTYHSISDHTTLILPSLEDVLQLEQCTLWQLKSIAIEHNPELAHFKNLLGTCPSFGEYGQISVHTTQQYPLPAMHIDESTIDGTFQVYNTLTRHLGLTNEALANHSILFVDGDLLTDSLLDKVASARRNSEEVWEGMMGVLGRFGIFHCKMAGNRMVMNEHWGTPNSKWAGSLWWEHTQLLKRKPISAGWQAKKVAPWKQSHELIQISLAAHVLDGFRIYCGHEDFKRWATKASMDDFHAVAKKVHDSLFTSAAHYSQSSSPTGQDTVLMNNILYNRDAIMYWLLVTSIKAGNIGRIVLVLRIWMVMMRTPKTMPRYANAIFETLGRLQEYPEKLRVFYLHNWLVNLTGRVNGFKEYDLLQEQQNRWIKTVFNAKGVNRSWEWLTMISVCIYSLRDAMRTIEKTFRTPYNSTRHTVPDMSRKIQCIADALRDEKVQEYVPNRPANDVVQPVRDLFKEGSKHANKRTAFSKYRKNNCSMENLGYQEIPEVDVESEDESNDSDLELDYTPTEEDLTVDDEEPELTEMMIDNVVTMVRDILE